MLGTISGSGRAYVEGTSCTGETKAFVLELNREGELNLNPGKGVRLGMFFQGNPDLINFSDWNLPKILQELSQSYLLNRVLIDLPALQDAALDLEDREYLATSIDNALANPAVEAALMDRFEQAYLRNDQKPVIDPQGWDFDKTLDIARMKSAEHVVKFLSELRGKQII